MVVAETGVLPDQAGIGGMGSWPALPQPVHADVVDEHGRRKDCIRLWIAVEVAADGKIEDHEKRLIEYPSAVRLHFAASDRVMDGIIDKESDVEGVPFDGVGVERVRADPRTNVCTCVIGVFPK